MNNTWSESMTKRELAAFIFNDELKAAVRNTLTHNYGVKEVNYRLLNYGMGIEISGSDSFTFIRDAMCKVAKLPAETFSVLGENAEKGTAFYVYLPEKDRALQKRLNKK